MSWSRRHWLWSMMWPGVGTLVMFGGALALLATAPALARLADRHHLPGLGIVLALITVTAAVSLLIVRSWFPRGRRAKQMAMAASSLGLRYRARFHLPRSLHKLASQSSPGTDRTYSNLLSGRREGEDALIFDVNLSSPSGYVPGHVMTCAAGRHDLDAPFLIIEPRHHDTIGHEVSGLPGVRSESLDFDRRYRVRAEDSRFASAVVDARLMAWLLDLRTGLSFELGGEWILCSAPEVDASRLIDLVEALGAFRKRVPRVAFSLYPKKPQVFA